MISQMENRRRSHPRVVILGAGFGGLWAAKEFQGAPAEVLLIDANNYHLFLPLLYQVAAAEVEPEEIAYPIRRIFRSMPNISFLLAEVEKVNPEERAVSAAGRVIPFDYLIVAIGSASNFFGVKGADQYAFPLKTLEEGIEIRNRILRCFEYAEHETDAELRGKALTFVIVGGGPTGVEFAGALLELIRGPLQREFRNLCSQEARVVLFQAADRLIPELPPRLSRYAFERLSRMGVEVHLDSRVTEVTPHEVRAHDQAMISTSTVIWTAGVKGAPQAAAWGFPLGKNGRIPVLSTLQSRDHPRIYVIGDLAYMENGRSFPMVAPVAIQQGVCAARNIRRQISGHLPIPFHYKDRGLLATIGRNSAVAHTFGRSFVGFPAWALWLGVHLFELIGFRNRIFVMLDWAWDYFFFERMVRLILPGRQDVPARMLRAAGENAPSHPGEKI